MGSLSIPSGGRRIWVNCTLPQGFTSEVAALEAVANAIGPAAVALPEFVSQRVSMLQPTEGDHRLQVRYELTLADAGHQALVKALVALRGLLNHTAYLAVPHSEVAWQPTPDAPRSAPATPTEVQHDDETAAPDAGGTAGSE